MSRPRPRVSRRVSEAVVLLTIAPCTASESPTGSAAASAAEPPRFADVTDEMGLGQDVIPETVARVVLADLDADDLPDVIADRHRVFLNRAGADVAAGRRFEEIPPARTGLEAPRRGTTVVFADLDQDGLLDAVTAEFVDGANPDWIDHGRRTRWQRGRGNGTFEPARMIPTPPRTTIAVAIGDVNGDGRADLWFGNTYVRYGHAYDGHRNDLLLSVPDDERTRWRRHALPEERHAFEADRDLGGRPTFGALIVPLAPGATPALLELSYGRRWNRLWEQDDEGAWSDLAPARGIDGDSVRHGRHPEWLAERAREDPRFARDDELPFRANGNTFDAAVGDVDGDGRLDLLLTEITHAWAGESSDRTRILLAPPEPGAFRVAPAMSLDRLPEDPTVRSWNQGDLFGALADLDHDGRLDVIVSSGDYPDDERLRIWRQRAGGGLEEVTAAWGIDHDGAQQISLGDVDGDGDLDILVGQTFNRFRPAQREGRSPRVRLLRNDAAPPGSAVHLRLDGDGVVTHRQGLGAVAVITTADGLERIVPVVGPGGHAGKQHDPVVHIGLGAADHVREVVVHWNGAVPPTRVGRVPAGRWRLDVDGTLRPDGAASTP